MRTIISTLAIFLIVTTLSMNAQPRSGYGINPLISQYGEELNLSNDQMTELAELNLEYRQETRGSMRDRRGNRGFRANRGNNRNFQRAEAWSDYQEKLMEILTEEQKEYLRNAVMEQAERAHQFRMIQHEVMVDEAGLTGEKRQQVLSMMNEHSRRILEARSESMGTPGFGQFRGQNYESRRDLQNELKGLLTVEEYQNLQEVMGPRRLGVNGRTGRRGFPCFN